MRVPSLLALLLALAACQSIETEDAPDTRASREPRVHTQEIEYEADRTQLLGFAARDANQTEPRPGVLVVHEWWGHTDYARQRAQQLAELGYVAFALDMYGAGVQAEHPEDAQAFMKAVMQDTDALERRFRAAIDVLHAQPGVDRKRTAAIGYCMGGAIALHMARLGTDLDGVVSFHGSLGTQRPARSGEVGAKLLVLTGGEDPLVPDEQVEAFREEMRKAGASFEIVKYPGVKHAFTNPGATAMGERFDLPLEYDAEADADSWWRMQAFFEEIF